jgi:hypothetical protein
MTKDEKKALGKATLTGALHLLTVYLKIAAGFYKANPLIAVADVHNAVTNASNLKDAVTNAVKKDEPPTPEPPSASGAKGG